MLLLLNRWGHWGTERLRNLSTVCSEAIFGHSYSLSRCLLKHGFYVSFPSLEIWIHTSWRADLPPTRPSGSPPAWPRLFPHLMPHSPLVWTLPLVTSSSHLPPCRATCRSLHTWALLDLPGSPPVTARLLQGPPQVPASSGSKPRGKDAGGSYVTDWGLVLALSSTPHGNCQMSLTLSGPQSLGSIKCWTPSEIFKLKFKQQILPLIHSFNHRFPAEWRHICPAWNRGKWPTASLLSSCAPWPLLQHSRDLQNGAGGHRTNCGHPCSPSAIFYHIDGGHALSCT